MNPFPPLTNCGLTRVDHCQLVIDDERCGEPATQHVIWELGPPEILHSAICAAHFPIIKRRWMFYAVHEFVPECANNAAGYDEERNRCIEPEDIDDLTAEVDRRLELVTT